MVLAACGIVRVLNGFCMYDIYGCMYGIRGYLTRG